jgi:hypothetical protein
MQIIDRSKIFFVASGITIFQFFSGADIYSQTEILKWKDGKSSCVSITFDDGSKNQFEIAMPVLDNLGFPATFFINTGNFYGSKYHPTFIGRPIMDILKESETIPANQSNLYERTSMIRYLREIQNIPEIRTFDMYRIGNDIENERFEEVYKTVNEICDILRKSKKVFEVRSLSMEPMIKEF